MWSMIPLSNFFPFAGPSHVSRNSRWTLGGELAKQTLSFRCQCLTAESIPASDIMFTKPLHSKFFTLGQVIETHRGGGIFQPAVDQAVKLLQTGAWVSEG